MKDNTKKFLKVLAAIVLGAFFVSIFVVAFTTAVKVIEALLGGVLAFIFIAAIVIAIAYVAYSIIKFINNRKNKNK